MQIECAHRESGRNCPISKTPCLGECIYANILDDISLGIIGLDVRKKEVFFQNKMAVDIFKETISPKDYDAILSLLLPNLDLFLSSQADTSQRTLRFGTRFLGYTIYRIAEMYLWIYIIDITEKVRLDSIAEAVNTMNNLGYIFSGIRHELGNPINSIKTTITVLRSKIDSFSRGNVIEYIDRALWDITRVESLLKDLKNFSMYENPMLTDVHLSTFLNNLLSMVERDFINNSIRVKINLSSDAEIGYFDPRALQHVLLNLLSNASDALAGRKNPEIVISCYRSDSRIIITVKDNGAGIPEEQKKHLFKPFATTKTKGTGLGLVIVKKMLTKMDGAVRIKSMENAGTTVTLDLPAGRLKGA